MLQQHFAFKSSNVDPHECASDFSPEKVFLFGCYLCWTASVLCCGSACASVVFELCGQHCVEASVPALMLVCCTISDNNVCTSDGNNVCLL